MGRAPCCEKVGLNRGPWTSEEDQTLIDHINHHGHANWRKLPKKAGLLRCGKSCRLRWINYLRPDLKRGDFTKEEEETLIKLQLELGNKWSAIAKLMPGRTDNEIKNVWNTHLKKKVDDHNIPIETKKRPRKRSKIVPQNNVNPQVQNAQLQDSTKSSKIITQNNVTPQVQNAQESSSSDHVVNEATLELSKNGDQNSGNLSSSSSSSDEKISSPSVSMASNNNNNDDDSLSKFLEIEDDFSWIDAMPADLYDDIIPSFDGNLHDENMEFWYNIYTNDGGIEDLLQDP